VGPDWAPGEMDCGTVDQRLRCVRCLHSVLAFYAWTVHPGEFVSKWSPRVGTAAARFYYTSRLCLRSGALVAPVWILCFVVVVFNGSSTSKAVGAISGGVDVLLLLAGWICAIVSCKAMSRFLGFQVRLTDSPTLREDSFVRWSEMIHGDMPQAGDEASSRDKASGP